MQDHEEDEVHIIQPQSRTTLNDIFKQVVVGREWKAHVPSVVELLKGDENALISDLQSIILKVMVIPAPQSKSANELITIFCKLYEQLLKTIGGLDKGDPSKVATRAQANLKEAQGLNKLLYSHIETAFKLTTRNETHFKNRSYQWLETLVDAAPTYFWVDRKRRVIKSLYTHAIDTAKMTPSGSQDDQIKNQMLSREPFKEFALKIGIKFQTITRECGQEEYNQAIRSNLLQMLAEDPREKFRRTIIERMELKDMKPLELTIFVNRTLDHASSVREAVYQRLWSENIDLNLFGESDRTDLIVNGLKDHEQKVIDACRVYLVQQFCLQPEFRKKDISQLQDEWLQQIDFVLPKLNMSCIWNDTRLTECLKLLFSEVIVPTYSQQLCDKSTTLPSLIKKVLLKELDSAKGCSKAEMTKTYEHLVFLHLYLVTVNEAIGIEELASDSGSREALPPLVTLQRILQTCCSPQAIKEANSSDCQPQANTLSRLISFQVLQILWYHITVQQHIANTKSNFQEGEDVAMEQEENKEEEDEGQSWQKKCADLLIDLAANVDFFDFSGQESNFTGTFSEEARKESLQKINTLADFQSERKKMQSDLIYIDNREDTLKEALFLLKNCIGNVPDTVVALMAKFETSTQEGLLHRLRLLKALLQTTKLAASSPEERDDRKTQIDQFESLVTQTLEEGSKLENSAEVKFKGIEALGLLMVLDVAKFDKYVDMFVKAIDEERPEPRKSKQVSLMLRSLFDGLVVHSYLLKSTLTTNAQGTPSVVSGFSGGLDTEFQQRKLKVRQLLMRQLRDADFNVRLLATEGFCRLLMCESADKPLDFIARLMLLGFEKVSQVAGRPVLPIEEEIHKRIKQTIEQFLSHFVRLSKGRCTEIAVATTQVIYYLLKAKSNAANSGGLISCDPSFLQINLFYMFGTIADLLKYSYNRDFAIFDFSESRMPISFQLQLFEFFALSVLMNGNGDVQLTQEEDMKMTSFVVDALDFLHFEELPQVLRFYEETFESVISPLFQLIFQKLQLFNYMPKQIQKVKEAWVRQTTIYLKQKQAANPSTQDASGTGFSQATRQAFDPEEYVRKKISELGSKVPTRGALCEIATKLANRQRCDVPKLLPLCESFIQSMKSYQSDFMEQKQTLCDENEMAKRMSYQKQKNQDAATAGVNNNPDCTKTAVRMLRGKTTSYSLKKTQETDAANSGGQGSTKKRDQKRQRKAK